MSAILVFSGWNPSLFLLDGETLNLSIRTIKLFSFINFITFSFQLNLVHVTRRLALSLSLYLSLSLSLSLSFSLSLSLSLSLTHTCISSAYTIGLCLSRHIVHYISINSVLSYSAKVCFSKFWN